MLCDKDANLSKQKISNPCTKFWELFPLNCTKKAFFPLGQNLESESAAALFCTAGKLCLQHEDVAKKCVAALARELEVSTDPIIRNNVVIIMADLCVRLCTCPSVKRFLAVRIKAERPVSLMSSSSWTLDAPRPPNKCMMPPHTPPLFETFFE